MNSNVSSQDASSKKYGVPDNIDSIVILPPRKMPSPSSVPIAPRGGSGKGSMTCNLPSKVLNKASISALRSGLKSTPIGP